MAYDRSYWKDHVTDQSGEVIQQGTLLDQQHFNNMELGISDMTLPGQLCSLRRCRTVTTTPTSCTRPRCADRQQVAV